MKSLKRNKRIEYGTQCAATTDFKRRNLPLLRKRNRVGQYGWTIEYMEIMPDHIHIFIKATPSDSISHIVSQLKGYTSFVLRNEFETIRKRLPSLWTRSFYVETIGHISESVIKKYIDDQKKH